MFKKIAFITIISLALIVASCGGDKTLVENDSTTSEVKKEFSAVTVDRFADIQVLRYEINDFDNLSLDQKKLVYFLSQAGLAGRDIIYDQNNPYNLEIRQALESIVEKFDGDQNSDDWNNFMTYTNKK